MNADDITRLLISLVMQLPPEWRGMISNGMVLASGTMHVWVPVVVALLVGVVLVCGRFYWETMDV